MAINNELNEIIAQQQSIKKIYAKKADEINEKYYKIDSKIYKEQSEPTIIKNLQNFNQQTRDDLLFKNNEALNQALIQDLSAYIKTASPEFKQTLNDFKQFVEVLDNKNIPQLNIYVDNFINFTKYQQEFIELTETIKTQGLDNALKSYQPFLSQLNNATTATLSYGSQTASPNELKQRTSNLHQTRSEILLGVATLNQKIENFERLRNNTNNPIKLKKMKEELTTESAQLREKAAKYYQDKKNLRQQASRLTVQKETDKTIDRITDKQNNKELLFSSKKSSASQPETKPVNRSPRLK